MTAADTTGARLPWRQPFQGFDRMVECVPHERILTVKQVTADDLMGGPRAAAGALPGSGPGLPEAMVIEGLSQSAALLFAMSYDTLACGALPVLGDMKATRHGAAAAGETVRFSVRAVKMTSTAGLFEARAEADGRLIADAAFAMSVTKAPADVPGGAA